MIIIMLLNTRLCSEKKKKNNEESKNSNLWNRVAQHTKIFLLKKTMKIIF